jgi:RNA polymerase sigma-70 factor (ECF subfamily)
MDTPASLLERLRQPAPQEAWVRFVELYVPLLYRWARRLGLQEADAADLVQEVLLVLHRRLPGFAYDPGQSFRAWLRTVLLNKYREGQRRRVPAPLDANGPALAGLPGPEGLDVLEETEYRRHLVGRALAIMQRDFPPVAWRACWESVVAGRPAAEVAAELGISAAAVYVAKFRVLRRLRTELEGLLE